MAMCEGPPPLGSAHIKMYWGTDLVTWRSPSNTRAISSFLKQGKKSLMMTPPNSRMARAGLLLYSSFRRSVFFLDNQWAVCRTCLHLKASLRSNLRHASQIIIQSLM